MQSMFNFSPTSSIAINTISKISAISKGSTSSANLLQFNGVINVNKTKEKNDIEEQEKEDNNPNNAIIKLLEDKKNDLKKNIETISNQLRRHIRQVEYIDSRICELRGEKVDSQNSRLIPGLRLDSELFQASFSRLSTTINTGINTPNSELASSNDVGVRDNFFHYKMDGDWVVVPEFKEIIGRVVNSP